MTPKVKQTFNFCLSDCVFFFFKVRCHEFKDGERDKAGKMATLGLT